MGWESDIKGCSASWTRESSERMEQDPCIKGEGVLQVRFEDLVSPAVVEVEF